MKRLRLLRNDAYRATTSADLIGSHLKIRSNQTNQVSRDNFSQLVEEFRMSDQAASILALGIEDVEGPSVTDRAHETNKLTGPKGLVNTIVFTESSVVEEQPQVDAKQPFSSNKLFHAAEPQFVQRSARPEHLQQTRSNVSYATTTSTTTRLRVSTEVYRNAFRTLLEGGTGNITTKNGDARDLFKSVTGLDFSKEVDVDVRPTNKSLRCGLHSIYYTGLLVFEVVRSRAFFDQSEFWRALPAP